MNNNLFSVILVYLKIAISCQINKKSTTSKKYDTIVIQRKKTQKNCRVTLATKVFQI